MASMKQVVSKYAGRVEKMVKQGGRGWSVNECWEMNIEGLEGHAELIEAFHAEMKAASDFVKAERPVSLDRSDMLEEVLQAHYEGVRAPEGH